MSVDQVPTRQPPSRAGDSQLVRYEDFIESKIQSTRWMVKAVDLATALVTLVTGVLAYLFVIALAEHWILPAGFSTFGRTVLFAILLGGVGYFIYRRIWPLLVRAINPVYAARAIEHNSPMLKNSLINLLFFRERRTGISDAVYRTLEEQAAQRLTRVPVETPVDRSLLIHLGYVLIGVVALTGLYKVFSPKDPFVSVERVLLPWAKIVPASRVSIAAVMPGSVTVSRGEFVDVSAEVHGLKDSEAIVLRYTAEDGQVVGKTIPMKPSGDGLRYTCRVSDDADGSESVGLTRSLKYRLEAGDARSLDYAITVISAPSILVERVDYHYPAYTGFVDRSVDGLGDIRAIEGTRMTIHARANGVIKVADVDFDADGRPDLRMTSKDTAADAAFELSLREDRVTPRHASYVLRFTNEEGRVNRDPVKHAIAVERDYDPEAAVLLPKEQAIDARLDEAVVIEIEARDPDFALSAVRLAGEVMHQSMLDESLLKGGQHRGRFTARYSFVPSAHGLKAGDLFEYWIEASDNRAPKANTVATTHRTMRIVSPNPGQQPQPNQIARNDRQLPKSGEQQGGEKNEGGQQQGNQQKGDNQGQQNQGGAADQKNQNNQQQGGEGGGQKNSGQSQGDQKSEKSQGGGEGGKNGQQNSGDQQQQSKDKSQSGGQGQGSNSQGSEQKDGQQKPGEQQSGNQKSGEQKPSEQKSGEQGQSGSQSKSSNGASDSSHDQQQNKGEQTGAGASGGEKSKDNAEPVGARRDQGDKSQPPNDGQQQKGNEQQGDQKNGGGQKGDKQPQSGDQKPAVSSEGDNDGEAIERMQKHMEQNGDLKKDDKSSNDAGQKADQEQGASKEQGSKQEGSKQGGDKQDGEKSQQQQSGGDKSQEQGKSADVQSASADQKNGDKKGDPSLQDKSPGQGKDQNQSAGAKPNGNDASDKKDQNSEGAKGEQKSPEGQETGSKGPGGAGEQKQNQSTPNSQDDKKPTEKHQQSASKQGTDKQDPASGGSGKKESDSSGDQGGDKTGGGEEGAGQKAPREGTGSAGDHQSADNGTGQSAEKGKGDTSSSGGKDAKSDHSTGSSDGKTQGKGGQQKDGSGTKPGGSAGKETAESPNGKNAAGEKGDKAGSKEGEAKGTDSKTQQDGKSSDKQPEKDGQEVGKQGDQKADGSNKNSDQKSKDSDSNQQGNASGPTEGGGKPGSQQPSITGTAAEGDAANLEYARKKTDLVLEKLSDQLNKNKVDDRMLKDLGWTRDDLKRFVDRWQQRKEAAQRDDPKGEAAKRELDDALRSLGLRRDTLQQNAVQKDSMRDLKQGYRGAVPLEYQERLRAYNQGVSRATRDGE